MLKNIDKIVEEEAIALIRLFGGKDGTDCEAVYDVNDGNLHKNQILGETPKERILNRLNQLKDGN